MSQQQQPPASTGEVEEHPLQKIVFIRNIIRFAYRPHNPTPLHDLFRLHGVSQAFASCVQDYAGTIVSTELLPFLENEQNMLRQIDRVVTGRAGRYYSFERQLSLETQVQKSVTNFIFRNVFERKQMQWLLRTMLSSRVSPSFALFGQCFATTGEYPLVYLAARSLHFQALEEMLTDFDADPLAPAMIREQPHTAVHFAARENHPQLLRMLMSVVVANSDVERLRVMVNNRRASDGATPLHVAAMTGASDSVRLLLSSPYGAVLDLNATDKQGSTALLCAVKHLHNDTDKYFRVIELLLEAGAFIEILLQSAMANEVESQLFGTTAQFSKSTKQLNLLHHIAANTKTTCDAAANASSLALAKLILEQLKKRGEMQLTQCVNAEARLVVGGPTPLVLAIEQGASLELIEMLLQFGAKTDVTCAHWDQLRTLSMATKKKLEPGSRQPLVALALVMSRFKDGPAVLRDILVAKLGVPEADVSLVETAVKKK